MAKTANLPAVLSFQRGTVVSDGIMSSILPNEALVPIRVIRHGIRGTLTKNEKVTVSNPQRTESAKTVPNAVGLSVKFTWRTLPAKSLLFACAERENDGFREKITGFIDASFKKDAPELEEVCRRYARNILNGRWLWRNRVLGEVSVTAYVGDEKFSSEKEASLEHFNDYSVHEMQLGKIIEEGMLRDNGGSTIRVEGRVMFDCPGAVEVFPSQNMVTSKPKGFARSLYKINPITRKELSSILLTENADGSSAGEFAADMIDMGEAALRDQKIGNAIRTIDTWYSGFKDRKQIIPIEPCGTSIDANSVFRPSTKEAKEAAQAGFDGKSLLSRLATIDSLKIPGEDYNPFKAYLIALLIRGGVFSEKDE